MKKIYPKFNFDEIFEEISERTNALNSKEDSVVKNDFADDSPNMASKPNSDGIEVIKNSRGDETFISTFEKQIYGGLKFAVKVERRYKNGESYQGGVQYWSSEQEAKTDANHWRSLGRKTDW